MAARAGTPGAHAWILPDHGIGKRRNRVLTPVFMAFRAAQTTVRIVQRKARVVREGTEVLEVVFLAMTRFATPLHFAFVHVFVAFEAGLGAAEIAQLAFCQDRFVCVRMTIDAAQLRMPTV